MTSRRLPGKSLRPLCGRPLLEWVIRHLRQAQSLSAIVVATSNQSDDNDIAAFCAREKIPCHRGPLDDVAARMIGAVRALGADAFVRISGDSPLIDPAVVDHAVRLFQAGEVDLVTNAAVRSFPKGCSVEVVRLAVLERMLKADGDTEDREHVTRILYRKPEAVRMVSFTSGLPCGAFQLSVDTQEDFARITDILEGMPEGAHPGWKALVGASGGAAPEGVR